MKLHVVVLILAYRSASLTWTTKADTARIVASGYNITVYSCPAVISPTLRRCAF